MQTAPEEEKKPPEKNISGYGIAKSSSLTSQLYNVIKDYFFYMPNLF